MDNEWKDKLRERFSDYSVPEPEGLWEAVEREMAGNARRRRFPLWPVAGVAAAAAVALVVLLPSGKEDRSSGQKEVYVESLSPAPVEAAPEVTAPEEGRPVAEPSREPVKSEFRHRPLLADAVERTVPETMKDQSVEASAAPETFPDRIAAVAPERVPDTIPEQVPDTVPDQIPDTVPERTAETVSDSIPDTQPDDIPAGASVQPSSGPRITLGLSHEGGEGAEAISQGYGFTRSDASRTRSSYGNNSVLPEDLFYMLNANQPSDFVEHHDAPFRVGIAVAWHLTPSLSLVSGVNWTSLSSTFTQSSGLARLVTSQQLGYLGIPLRLEAGIQPWKGLRLYAGAGGMVEKGLQATSTTRSYMDGQLQNREESVPDTGGLLWSVGAVAGAEYRFSPHFGIYFAPGLEYHFDNGAPLRSAYTEKPLHTSLSLGIRFNFAK